MGFLQICAIVFPVFVPIFIGFILVKTGIYQTKDAKVLTTFFLYVAIPALLIHLFSTIDIMAVLNVSFLIAILVGTLVLFGLTYAIYRFVLRQPVALSALASLTASYVNAGIIGLPVLILVIPESIAVISVVLDAVVALMILLPIVLLIINLSIKDRKHTHWYIIEHSFVMAFTNPIVVATVIGVLLSASRIHLPDWLGSALLSLSQATFGVALVAVGMSIHLASLKKNAHAIMLIAFIKLVIAPVIGISLAVLFDLEPTFALALVVILGLPTAKAAFVVAEEYDLLVDQTAGVITVTTLLGIVVIPTLIYLSKLLW